MPASKVEHTLVVPSHTRHLGTVRRFVERHAAKAELPEDAIHALRLSVDEACTNIIEHAYDGRGDEQVDIAMSVEPDRVVVCIRDRGRAFDVRSYVEPDVLRLSRQRKAGGLGVNIIRKLMDFVEYRSDGSVNEIRLTKSRGPHAG